ncbi:MAG: 23S rRNA (uracil(1939)-C(5))-methyltransferase RlmD [Gammaproteobacteria bacterium]
MARVSREPVEVVVESLSHEGRGVARRDGKTVFVFGALPGERVQARITRRRGSFDEAEATAVETPAPARIEPRCEHFGVCGGCGLQHVDEDFQLAHKQAVLLELLRHHAGVQPESVAAPIRGPQWGYRRKARLGLKHVPRKGGVIIGFRERGSPFITDCQRCDTLDPRVGTILPALRALIDGLSIPDRIPQFEVAVSDERVALVLRHLAPLSEADRDTLAVAASELGVEFYLQAGGPDTVVPLAGEARPLVYRVDDLALEFAPTDFTQVNPAINAQMVARALDYLAPAPTDRVADLFCGLGNFTLPIARRAGTVIGVEGDEALTTRAAANAAANGIANVDFAVTDLARPEAVAALMLGSPNKMLLDPPRAGAAAVIEGVALAGIERLVYVSCNPVTFVRDAAVLRRTHGFVLAETGILDMFPQTAHVESISLFVRR